jgi:hypothetical protein
MYEFSLSQGRRQGLPSAPSHYQLNTLDALDETVCGRKGPNGDDFTMLGVIAGAGVLLLMLLVI